MVKAYHGFIAKGAWLHYPLGAHAQLTAGARVLRARPHDPRRAVLPLVGQPHEQQHLDAEFGDVVPHAVAALATVRDVEPHPQLPLLPKVKEERPHEFYEGFAQKQQLAERLQAMLVPRREAAVAHALRVRGFPLPLQPPLRAQPAEWAQPQVR